MATKTISVIKGTDRAFNIRIINKSSGDPKDLSGLSGEDIELALPLDDGTVLTLSEGDGIEVLSAMGGKIRVSLSDSQTALLKAKCGQSMELTLKEGAGPDFEVSKIQFLNALNVKAGVFDDE